MINLLPDELKDEIAYGRRNRVMLRWIVSVITVIGGVVAMTVFGQLYIIKNVVSLQQVSKLTQNRVAAQNLETTQKDIQNLSNNFKTVTQLLGKQLLFSKLFIKIGGIIPQGAILSGISLSNTSSGLDLNINAINRESATQAFVNINDPKNGLFEKADLLSVGCVNAAASKTSSTVRENSTLSKYPCTALIKVVIKPDSNFYFLNSITTGGAKKP